MPTLSTAYSTRAPAKINLFLDIVGGRPGGYHEIRTVLRPIELADEVQLRLRGDGHITFSCDDPSLPSGAENLAVKAALALQEAFPGRIPGCDISLGKRIPSGAGLGGGSADAAAILRLLREAANLDATDEALAHVAANVGSDAPAMAAGGTVEASGRGEILKPLANRCEEGGVVLVCPAASVSTRDAYRWWDEDGAPRTRATAGQMAEALARGDWGGVVEACENAFQEIIERRVPEVASARRALIEAGCAKAVMTGSGAAVFGLTPSLDEAWRAADRLAGRFPLVTAVPFRVPPLPAITHLSNV